MSKLTPPAGAADVKLTVNVKVVVPESPSAIVTSSIESDGVGNVPATGEGAPAVKSVPF